MENFEWKQTIKDNIFLLRMLGLWPKDDSYKFDSYTALSAFLFTTFYLIGVLAQIINLFYIYHDLTILTRTIYLLVTEMLFGFKVYCMIKNTPLLKQLMKVLDADLFQPKTTRQVVLIQASLDTWTTVYKIFLVICWGTDVFWAIYPLLDRSNLDRQLPYIAWYPYDAKKFPFYQLTYLHQVASYTYTIFSHVNMDMLIAALNVYVGCQFDILCENLRNLHEGNPDTNVINCVEHQKMILNFVQGSNSFFSWIIFYQFFISGTMIGLTLFHLTVVAPLSSEFFTFMSYGFSIIMQIFMYCWYGNEVEVKSKKLSSAAFESNWTGLSLKVQKSLFLIILRSQEPVQMSAFKMFPLSLESFVKILRTAWSYFAVLQQVNSQN